MDVLQDYTLVTVGRVDREKILSSVRHRFNRLHTDLHRMVQYSVQLGANRYQSEHPQTDVLSSNRPSRTASR